MFALQVGSMQQLPACNVQLDADLPGGKVLLQYTRNKVTLLSVFLLYFCAHLLFNFLYYFEKTRNSIFFYKCDFSLTQVA